MWLPGDGEAGARLFNSRGGGAGKAEVLRLELKVALHERFRHIKGISSVVELAEFFNGLGRGLTMRLNRGARGLELGSVRHLPGHRSPRGDRNEVCHRAWTELFFQLLAH